MKYRRLAKSIRSQLPYPDEAPPVEELFAMVDRDIQANGQQENLTRYDGKRPIKRRAERY